MALRVVRQRGSDARNDAVPDAGRVLPKQPTGRVPWAIISIEQPPPTCVIAIEEPKRLSKRSREVCYGGIDRNDKVEILD